jgi:hypothetical protein
MRLNQTICETVYDVNAAYYQFLADHSINIFFMYKPRQPQTYLT